MYIYLNLDTLKKKLFIKEAKNNIHKKFIFKKKKAFKIFWII